jgi:hypothetical protein
LIRICPKKLEVDIEKHDEQEYKGIVVRKATEVRMTPPGLEH